MAIKKFRLHDGKKGSAIAVRVIPRAKNNEIVEIMSDGTVKVRLAAQPTAEELNTGLIDYLSSVLGVKPSQIEIVAGMSHRSKLVSVVDMNSSDVHQRILQNLT
jgi:hypothetical protein